MSLDLRQHIRLKVTGSELQKFHERTSILPVLFAGNKCPPAARNLIPRTPEDNIYNTIYIKIQLYTLKALFQFLILHSSGHPKQELVAKGNVIQHTISLALVDEVGVWMGPENRGSNSFMLYKLENFFKKRLLVTFHQRKFSIDNHSCSLFFLHPFLLRDVHETQFQGS